MYSNRWLFMAVPLDKYRENVIAIDVMWDILDRGLDVWGCKVINAPEPRELLNGKNQKEIEALRKAYNHFKTAATRTRSSVDSMRTTANDFTENLLTTDSVICRAAVIRHEGLYIAVDTNAIKKNRINPDRYARKQLKNAIAAGNKHLKLCELIQVKEEVTPLNDRIWTLWYLPGNPSSHVASARK